MIDFYFDNANNVSTERKEDARQYFLNLLKDMKNEFDEKNGQVTIDFAAPATSHNFYNFTFPKHDIFEFTARWRAMYKKDNEPFPL